MTNGEATNLAWFKLYENFEEMQANIDRYLKNPPQIDSKIEDFEHKHLKLPSIDETSFKMVFNRLVPKDLNIQDRLARKHEFPLEKLDNFEEEIKDIQITI